MMGRPMSTRRIHRRLTVEELEPRIAPTTYHITDVNGLQAMQNDLAGTYILDNDIDASATSTWNSGAGFAPVGNTATPFAGSFDGGGHVITALHINRPSESYVGLFGYATGGCVIANVNLVGGGIAAGDGYGRGLGGLVGSLNGGTVSKCYASVGVTDRGNAERVGEIVGWLQSGAVSNCYAGGGRDGLWRQQLRRWACRLECRHGDR